MTWLKKGREVENIKHFVGAVEDGYLVVLVKYDPQSEGIGSAIRL